VSKQRDLTDEGLFTIANTDVIYTARTSCSKLICCQCCLSVLCMFVGS